MPRKNPFIPKRSCTLTNVSAVPYVKQTPPALILLDIQLPGKDGMAVCREVRQFSTVPIMMLTARVEEIDRLLGLELGADDYICKPFSPREVVARVKAILRRIQPTSVTEEKLVLGEITVDVKSHQVTIANQPLKLTPNEFALLAFFISHPNQVFSRQVLISQVQNYAFSGYERTIDSHIKNLRKKIATFLPDHEIISTVYRVGYKLNFPFSE
ncbi:MAG: two-component system response regulator BaeR [Candidatus Parabeggiatoa sp. nov. 2]|nr:MAG: two-component system response regulator BaeR [Beggiatoa sp. 4572_84]